MGRPRRSRLVSRGQTLVEFALILPVALLLTVGIIDVARLFSADISLTNGVREAALYAGSGAYVKWCSGDSTDVICPTGWAAGNISANAAGSIGFVVQGESAGLTLADIKLEPPVCDGNAGVPCSASSTTVTITASYPFRALTPIIGAIMNRSLAGHTDLGTALWITASTTAQIQK